MEPIASYKQIFELENMALASGFEPEFPASEASALSIKLRKQTRKQKTEMTLSILQSIKIINCLLSLKQNRY